MKYKGKCKHCGKKFTTISDRKMFCSSYCGDQYRKQKTPR